MIDSLAQIEKDLAYCRRRLEELDSEDERGRKIFTKAIATFECERDLVSFAGKWSRARR